MGNSVLFSNLFFRLLNPLKHDSRYIDHLSEHQFSSFQGVILPSNFFFIFFIGLNDAYNLFNNDIQKLFRGKI